MTLVDSHAHLDFLPEGRAIEEVLADSSEAGVEKIVCVGTSIAASRKSIEIAGKYLNNKIEIFATCGIHPQDGKDEIKRESLYRCIDTIKQIAGSSKKVVAIGECGLDYYLDSGGERPKTTEEEKEFQRELFKSQIKLAAELNLPLVVHCRNAWGEVFSILTELKQGLSLSGVQGETLLKGVFHSWTGDVGAAKKALDLGFYISFSGIVTFKNAEDIQEAAKFVPLDRLLIETDSPFLSPEPLRGKQNEPKNVRIIADFLASLLNVPTEKIYSVTTANCKRLFGIQ